MFIVENNKLKRILEDYTISNYSGDFRASCADGSKEEMESVIDIDKQHQSNQFNDLVISETVIATDYIKKKYSDVDCDEKRRIVKKTVRMQYDGIQYK